MIRAVMDATILPPWSALRSRPGGGMLAAMEGKGCHSCGGEMDWEGMVCTPGGRWRLK